MAASISTVGGILKEIYEDDIAMQLNDDCVILNRIEKASGNVQSEVGAKYVTFPVHVSRNNGLGARREKEVLPVAGNQGTTAARVGLKYLYGAVGMTGQTFDLVETNYQGFMSAMDLEMNRLKEDLAVDLNRMVYGNATGVVATTSTVGATGTLTITSGLYQLQIGEILDGFTAAQLIAETPKGTVTITGINAAAGTITVTPATVTWAAGDVLTRKGNANREWSGLGAMVNSAATSTAVYENIDPTQFPVWYSTVDANGGTQRPLAESLIIKNVDAVRTFGAKTSLLVTTLGVRRAYFALLSQQRQYMNTSDYGGGFTGLKFTTDAGEVPLIADIACTPNTLYGLSEKNIKLYREKDWSFMNRDGGTWKLAFDGTDAYFATMYQYSELGTDRRNAHFRINDITEA